MAISDNLTERRALVTGGIRGTGAAVVRRPREAGASDVATVEDTRLVIEAAGHLDVKCGGV